MGKTGPSCELGFKAQKSEGLSKKGRNGYFGLGETELLRPKGGGITSAYEVIELLRLEDCKVLRFGEQLGVRPALEAYRFESYAGRVSGSVRTYHGSGIREPRYDSMKKNRTTVSTAYLVARHSHFYFGQIEVRP